MNVYEAFGRKLRLIRREKRLTQTEAGALVGQSCFYISKVESGSHRIPLEKAIQIAQTLGFSLHELEVEANDS